MKKGEKYIPQYWDCKNCGNNVHLNGSSILDRIHLLGKCENCGSSCSFDYHADTCERVREKINIPKTDDITDIVSRYVQMNPDAKLETNSSYKYSDQEYFYIKTIIENNYKGWIFKDGY